MQIRITYKYGAIIKVSPDYASDTVRQANLGEIFNVDSHPIINADIEWYKILDGQNKDNWLYGRYISRIEGIDYMTRGTPRIQYKRTVNVVPANVTNERFLQIAKEAWDRGRETVTGSYDDAGIGDLDVRIVNLYDISISEQQKYRDFYSQYYPAVTVNFLPK